MSFVRNIPGLVFLPSFVPSDKQRMLVRWALCDQARHPNETNLDTHYVLPREGLWNEYLRVRKHQAEDQEVAPRASLHSTPAADLDSSQSPTTEPPGPRKLIANEAASLDNYEDLASTPKLPAAPSQTIRPISISSLIPKLRWANIGWYYHWGTKQYDFSRGPGEIADLVRGICRSAVGRIPWEQVFRETENGVEEDWGEEGPDWMHWKETYGRFKFSAVALKPNLYARTGCWNRQFLPD